MTDIKDQPITVPDVQVTADKRVVKTNAPIEVQPLDVTVELDGIAIVRPPGISRRFPACTSCGSPARVSRIGNGQSIFMPVRNCAWRCK